MSSERIDLAHTADFAIGPLSVHPSTREISRGEERQVIEPRVMQVLIALHRAGGAVVSKDDLALSCWEGRVVGEDAINRVLSRLRKLTETIAAGAFRIETITRVGYRMVAADGVIAQSGPIVLGKLPRRAVLAGGGVAALAAAASWIIGRDGNSAPIPDEADELVRRGQEAVLYGTLEQTALGISLLQQATTIAPEQARIWGLLSLAYGQQAQQSSQADYERLMAQAESAGQRARDLDPSNPEAAVAKVLGRRDATGRAERDRGLRAIVARYPDNPGANRTYSFFLSQVGRTGESLPLLQRAIAGEPFSPVDGYGLAIILWSMKRLDEADTAMERAVRLWPRHYGVWFSRYKHLVYTGRIPAARAMLDETGQRPTGIPETTFALCDEELKAFASRDPGDLARAMAAHIAAARTGVGFAQNAMTFAAGVGDADRLFEIADAMFFDRGFSPGEQRFTREQALFNPARRRPTYFLFSPPFAPYWRDPRFDALVANLGLKDYWRATNSLPDYLRSLNRS